MIYLDNAATTFPKPEIVYESSIDCMRNYCVNPGRGYNDMAIKCELKIMEARERIAKLFNINNPLDIIFTKNATEGLNIGIKGLLKKGDHVITTGNEHNSVLRVLYYLNKNGVEYSVVPINENGYVDTVLIKKLIRKNTKAIIINHASNVTGVIQDIEEIGKIAVDNKIVLLVDAAQSAGIIDIDVKKYNIDILAFSGHKSLFGLQGTGGIYISPKINIEFYNLGGTGSNSNLLEQPSFLPDKFESGTLNTIGIIALSEGINFIMKEGMKKIREYERKITKYFIEELKSINNIKLYGDISNKERCPVVSFNIGNCDSSDIGRMLNEKNIYVRTGYHCAPLIHEYLGTKNLGTVRVSMGYFTKEIEVEECVNTIREISKKADQIV